MGIKRIIIELDDNELDPRGYQPVGSQQWWDGVNSAPQTGQPYDPCEHCSNNPKNNPFASGICSCALPDMYRVRY